MTPLRGNDRSAHCQFCTNPSWQRATFLRMLVDFLWLYFIGLYELVYQAVQRRRFASRFHEPPRKQEGFKCGRENVVILSGATSGIGREIYRVLERREVRLILLTHSSEADPDAKANRVTVDFSSSVSTKLAAQEVRRLLSQLPNQARVVFIHCAGVYKPNTQQRQGPSSSPVFLTFAVNTVMPAFFLQSIGDLLTSVVILGSSSQKIAPMPSLFTCPFHIAKSPYSAYALSKMLTLAYVERWSHYNKKAAIVIHPGVVHTGLYRNERGFIGGALQQMLQLGALRADESANRVLQILDLTQFFEKRHQSKQRHMGHPETYWDVATMAPSPFPYQICDIQLRESLYTHISDATVTWTGS